MLQVIIAAISGSLGAAILGFAQFLVNRADRNKDVRTDYEKKLEDKINLQNSMLIGLGHDKIILYGNKYIERGYITPDEYENLNDYLFIPYKNLGGNGTAEKIMKEVEQLPTHL